jgi:hypothetical protein
MLDSDAYMPVLRRTRKQKFKDLMKHRTTVEQGLTFKQIFCEVYSDVVEKYTYRNPDLDRSEFNAYAGDILGLVEYEGQYGKIRYLKGMIKQVRKKDDEFRWLSIMPLKRNEVDKTTGRKVRPYLEYRYINLNASKTPELLEEVNKIWEKHSRACHEGLERKIKKIMRIVERISTPEGQIQHTLRLQVEHDKVMLAVDFFNRRKEINKIIADLKQEGRLPQSYKIDYDHVREILRREVINTQTLMSLPVIDDKVKRREEIRKLVKDTIEAFCDKKQIEQE